MDCYGAARMANWRSRAASEERPAVQNQQQPQPPQSHMHESHKITSGTPLLARRGKQVKMVKVREPSLYDRKLNRSFEKADSSGVISSSVMKDTNSPLRRSTPHLVGDEYLLDDAFRSSIAPTLCCANFMKQLRKMNQY